MVSPDGQEAVLIMEKPAQEERCPECGQVSYINNSARMQLKDVPIFAGCKQSLLCLFIHYTECLNLRRRKPAVLFSLTGTLNLYSFCNSFPKLRGFYT